MQTELDYMTTTATTTTIVNHTNDGNTRICKTNTMNAFTLNTDSSVEICDKIKEKQIKTKTSFIGVKLVKNEQLEGQ